MKVKGHRKNELFFEDIEENSAIPSIVKPEFTTSNVAAYGGVSGCFCAMHFDYGAAREFFNLPAPAVYGSLISQYMAQIITDWMGPNGTLKKLSSYLKTPVSPGDQLTMKGKVVKKYSKDNEYFVDCDIWAENQNGETVNEGKATVIVPLKKDK